MRNDAIALALAYPETVVRVSDEWYSPLLPWVGIGRKGYVRAGHAALVLIHKELGSIEYFDFGRYITPEPYGRVRSALTDAELHLPFKAQILKSKLVNLEDILRFLSSNPELTHGEGVLMASVCAEICFDSTKNFIQTLQNDGFIRYGAFKSRATNCVRFVTDALIHGTTNDLVRKRLRSTKWFTPSSISNVLCANTEDEVYEVSASGEIRYFTSGKFKTNARLFFDRLKDESFKNLEKVEPSEYNGPAQWLSGIGSGAWFQLIDIGEKSVYRFQRRASSGRLDIDGKYKISDTAFEISEGFQFLHNSNCLYFHIEQNNRIYRFDYVERMTS